MVSRYEDHDEDECPRCRLRRMLTTALTGGHRKQFANLLRYQLDDAMKFVNAICTANPATVDGELLTDLAVQELIATCDRVYQVAEEADAAQDELSAGGQLQTTMPAGRYWVGDLCYVLREEWHKVPFGDGIYRLADGRRIAKFTTGHGDGVYDDDQGNEYGVDSGSLGCILAADIRGDSANRENGALVTANAPFVPRRDGGVLHLAGLEIQLDADG